MLNTNIFRILIIIAAANFMNCNNGNRNVDLLVINANIYSVDSAFNTYEAMAIDNGLIVQMGTKAQLEAKYMPKKTLNAQGKSIFPGIIDAHCHFVGYANGLNSVNLIGTQSYDEVLLRTKAFGDTSKLAWITGRGWDQNDWIEKDFPTNEKLNALYPDKPVCLTRIDGHAVLANDKALEMAKIDASTKIAGGEVVVKNGKATGILIDNAITQLDKIIPSLDDATLTQALLKAQNDCFKLGVTSVADAGLSLKDILFIDSLQRQNVLQMGMYIMFAPDSVNLNYAKNQGMINTNLLTVRSFKVYADGALGSRGAYLKQPYSDANTKGLLLADSLYFIDIAQQCKAYGFQMNTHCIGDGANGLILNIYDKVLNGKQDLRWRIEHAQIVDKADLFLFTKNKVIPSIQATHATSDMYWAQDRLGPERIKTAYAYKDLLNAAGIVANGTDFPVEYINPFYTFHASVARQDNKNFPKNGFQKENALTRIEALRSMTIWAAYSNFQEKQIGSLEAGKNADFIILDRNLMEIDAQDMAETVVLKTFKQGKLVYAKQ